jgi:hypothetical protein
MKCCETPLEFYLNHTFGDRRCKKCDRDFDSLKLLQDHIRVKHFGLEPVYSESKDKDNEFDSTTIRKGRKSKPSDEDEARLL